MEKWLTKKEVAKILGVSIPTLDRIMARGQITYYKSSPAVSGRCKFLAKDVDAYIKKLKIN